VVTRPAAAAAAAAAAPALLLLLLLLLVLLVPAAALRAALSARSTELAARWRSRIVAVKKNWVVFACSLLLLDR
jgi:hypothetical protein